MHLTYINLTYPKIISKAAHNNQSVNQRFESSFYAKLEHNKKNQLMLTFLADMITTRQNSAASVKILMLNLEWITSLWAASDCPAPKEISRWMKREKWEWLLEEIFQPDNRGRGGKWRWTRHSQIGTRLAELPVECRVIPLSALFKGAGFCLKGRSYFEDLYI